MFLRFNAFLSPEGDVGSSGSAAPSNNNSSAGNSSSSSGSNDYVPYPTSDDLFKGFEDKLFSNMDDPDDILGGNNESEETENIDDPLVEANNKENTEQTETETVEADEDDGLPLYTFQAKVDGEDVDLVIENQEDLDNYLKRAVVAPKLYKENKELRSKIDELSIRASNADEFDRMAKEEPAELLELITEDMDEEQLVQWIREKAKYLGKSQEEREAIKKQRESEFIRKTWEQQQAAKQQIEKSKVEAETQAQTRLVESWRESEFTKWAVKVPEEHHELLKDLIDQQLLYASNLAREGKDVELKALSQRLFKFATALSGSRKQIEKKIGEQTQAARQQAKSKLQTVANTARTGGQNKPKNSMDFNGDTDSLFDSLSRGIESGRVTLRA